MTDNPASQLKGRIAPKGEVLFSEGDPGEIMYVIRSGRVRVSIVSHGVERELAVLGPGELVGEMSLLNSKPRTAMAVVVEDAELLAVDAYTFEEMILGNTEIALRLIRRLAKRLDAADRLIAVLIHREASARFALGLKRGAELHGSQEGTQVRVPMSVLDLAEQVGVTAEEARGVMAQLGRAGIAVEDGNDIVLKDEDKLFQFVEFLRTRPA